jgi:phosphoserine phosphatase
LSSQRRHCRFPVLLAQGKAKLKAFISARLDPDPGLLPYNENFLAWLREQAAVGRKLVLCTASDERVARSIAAYLGIFDEVLASDGNTIWREQQRPICSRHAMVSVLMITLGTHQQISQCGGARARLSW